MPENDVLELIKAGRSVLISVYIRARRENGKTGVTLTAYEVKRPKSRPLLKKRLTKKQAKTLLWALYGIIGKKETA